MQISHQSIVFLGDQTKKQVLLTNTTQSVIIFKNCKPSPARGFIEVKETKIVVVPAVRLEAKLMFNWANVQKKSQQFDDAWKKVPSSSFNQHYVPILHQPIISEKSMSHFQIQQEDSSSMRSSSMSLGDNLLNSKSNNSNTNNFSMVQGSKPNKNEGILSSITSPLSKTFVMEEVEKKQRGNNHNQGRKMEEKEIKAIKEMKVVETKFLKEEGRDPSGNFNGNNLNGLGRNLSMNQGQMNSRIQPTQSRQQMHNTSIGFQQNNIHNQNNNQMMLRQTSSQGSNSSMYGNFRGLDPNSRGIQLNSRSVNQLTELCFVQSQLLRERERNERLREELRRTKQVQREREEMSRQYSINKSMVEACNHEGVQWEGIIMVGLLFLVIGFLLSRF